LVVVENYPTLKSDATFMRLMDELAGTENRLAVERKRYNDSVQGYTVAVRRIPGNLFAGIFGFREQPFFEAPPAARQAPQVKF
jgi:LemA protein